MKMEVKVWSREANEGEEGRLHHYWKKERESREKTACSHKYHAARERWLNIDILVTYWTMALHSPLHSIACVYNNHLIVLDSESCKDAPMRLPPRGENQEVLSEEAELLCKGGQGGRDGLLLKGKSFSKELQSI